MRINDFAVKIIARDRPPVDSEYIFLPHESEYSIELINGKSVRCEAEVFIDSKSVGTFLLKSGSSIVIERPSNSARKFVFVQENSSEAQVGNVVTGKQDNGLVKVVFTPELIVREDCRQSFSLNSSGNQTRGTTNFGYCPPTSFTSAGATILGSSSSQRFNEARPLTNHDLTNRTTINLRLVVSESSGYAPLEASPRILSNPEPARLGAFRP